MLSKMKLWVSSAHFVTAYKVYEYNRQRRFVSISKWTWRITDRTANLSRKTYLVFHLIHNAVKERAHECTTGTQMHGGICTHINGFMASQYIMSVYNWKILSNYIQYTCTGMQLKDLMASPEFTHQLPNFKWVQPTVHRAIRAKHKRIRVLLSLYHS